MQAIKSFVGKVLKPGESLKWKTAQGFVLVLAGDAYKNVVRLAGSLIMTRMLFPEAFGIMLIITLLEVGLALLSDAGVRDALIIKSKGREREFVNTAWVFTIMRGGVLALITVALAWPMSQFYNQPILFELIMFSALSPLIRGFSSPQEFVYEKNVNLSRVMLKEVSVQTISLLVGILVLYFYPSVWVLVGMTILTTILNVIASFYLFKGPKLQFKMDKQAFSEMIGFGKWIFLASALTFFAAEADKLVVSKLLSLEMLGIFSIALGLAKMVEAVSGQVSSKLLVPVYASIDREDPSTFNGKVKKIKYLLAVLFIPPILIFSQLGDLVVDILYDERYISAGWMLQIMVVGMIFSVFGFSLSSVITAKGDVKAHLALYLYKVIVYFVLLISGGMLYGVQGVVAGIAIAPAFMYLAFSIYVMKYNIYALKNDVVIFAILFSLVFGLWAAFGWPQVI